MPPRTAHLASRSFRFGVVVTGVVPEQVNVTVTVLSSEIVPRGQGFAGSCVAYFTPRLVARFGHRASGCIYGEGGASQMVAEQVGEGGGHPSFFYLR